MATPPFFFVGSGGSPNRSDALGVKHSAGTGTMERQLTPESGGTHPKPSKTQ